VGKAHYKGKDLTEVRSPQRQLALDIGPDLGKQTSLRGIAIKASNRTCAKASTTEEPDAGKPHVRVCAGGAR